MHFSVEISALPSEILSDIFVLVKQSYDTRPGYYFKDGRLGWIKIITHVCHPWRDIALRTQTLWANIPVFNPRWASEMIERSRNIHTLVLNADFIDIPRPSLETTLLTLQHVGRVTEMSLRGIGEDELSKIFPPHNPSMQDVCCLHTLRVVGTTDLAQNASVGWR